MPVVTLDSWCANQDVVPDFIKIDIEGAELSALKGASEILKKYHPVIMVEVTENVNDVLHFLVEHGYDLITPEGVSVNPDEIDRVFNVFALPQIDKT